LADKKKLDENFKQNPLCLLGFSNYLPEFYILCFSITVSSSDLFIFLLIARIYSPIIPRMRIIKEPIYRS